MADATELARLPRARAPRAALARGWAGFRTLRRTRPFWGGLWLVVAGAWLLWSMRFDLVLNVVADAGGVPGHGAAAVLVALGLLTWLTPHYRALLAVLGVLVSLGAFLWANVGGYLIGTTLGLVGSALVAGWGPRSFEGGA